MLLARVSCRPIAARDATPIAGTRVTDAACPGNRARIRGNATRPLDFVVGRSAHAAPV
jgi:hypothetical protein